MSAQVVFKYFPDLSSHQQNQFASLDALYKEWNEKINVISRKDTEHLYLHHVLHSLSIARFITFNAKANIIDVGTGGGFPGLPLAILFPDTRFHLVDSIGKKINVVREISAQIGLKNITTKHGRAEEVREKFDFALIRAVAPMNTLLYWISDLIAPRGSHAMPNGIIALKGGDLKAEMKDYKKIIRMVPVEKYFSEDYFKEKYVVYCPVTN